MKYRAVSTYRSRKGRLEIYLRCLGETRRAHAKRCDFRYDVFAKKNSQDQKVICSARTEPFALKAFLIYHVRGLKKKKRLQLLFTKLNFAPRIKCTYPLCAGKYFAYEITRNTLLFVKADRLFFFPPLLVLRIYLESKLIPTTLSDSKFVSFPRESSL